MAFPVPSKNRRLRIRLAAAALLAMLVGAFLAPMAAWAYQTPTLAVSPGEDPFAPKGVASAGGTIILTLGTKTGPREYISGVTVVFPGVVDPSSLTASDLDLAGSYVTKKVSISGQTVTVTFDTSIPASTVVLLSFNNLNTQAKPGTYKLSGTIYGSSVQPFAPVSFTLARPTTVQTVVRALESVGLIHLFFSPTRIYEAIPFLFQGWIYSVFIVFVAYPSAMPVGLMLAFMKMSKLAPSRWIAAAYINVIRGTPLFLQIFFVFFGLPLVGFAPSLFIRGWMVLTLNSAAYMAEIFRGGIQSIDKGQMEAASSLGMTYPQAMAYVVIPQTVRRILPTMTSEFILLFKDTALLAAAGVFELMMYAKNDVANSGNVSAYVGAAAFYLLLTIPLIRLVGTFEARLALSESGGGARGKALTDAGALVNPALGSDAVIPSLRKSDRR